MLRKEIGQREQAAAAELVSMRVDSHGKPACANGKHAILGYDGRLRCELFFN
jgi:hypothetical protein